MHCGPATQRYCKILPPRTLTAQLHRAHPENSDSNTLSRAGPSEKVNQVSPSLGACWLLFWGRGGGVGKQPGVPFCFCYRSYMFCELPRFSLLCLPPSHLFPAAEDPGGWACTDRRSLCHTRDNSISLYTQVKQQGTEFSKHAASI